MASWHVPAISDGSLTGPKYKDEQSTAEQHIALVEGCDGCSEQELRTKLSPYGPIAWCNSVDSGRYLVRYLSRDGLSAAAQALHGSVWRGNTIRVAPYCIGSLVPAALQQVDSPFSRRTESIPALLQDQLDYFDPLAGEESQQSQQQGLLGQQSSTVQGGYPELEPCHPEWNPSAANELLMPLEDEVLSTDDSPMHSFTGGSGPSTSQLWTQRSIGAVARKDLAKFAALQSLVHQHSNSSTPAPGLTHSGSGLGLCGSPWGSFTAGSSGMDAAEAGGLAGVVRRVSSPAGHASVLTPRSNCSFTGGPGSTPSEAAGTPSQQLQLQHSGAACAGFTASGNNNSGWPSHLMQLPSDLGLGDACGDDPSGMRMAAAQQQPTAQQQLAQSSLNSETMSALLAGSILGGPSGFGDLIGRAVDSSGDLCGVLGVSSSVPPPPPPPAQQHSMLAQPPPPPRSAEGYSGAYGGSDGRLSGAASPVPAPPPPRAITPGGGSSAPGQVWGPSPAASPRFAGPPQPQSPGVRPPRAAMRLFQPGMSNLGHPVSGGNPPGLHPQHSYDGTAGGTAYVCQQQPMLPTGAFNQPPAQCTMQQPQPPYRVPSPVNRGVAVPPIVPPPPPPSMPPPGYAAASAAAAAHGICGSPVPPASPAGRPGSMCGPLALPGMQSCPNGMLEAMGSSNMCLSARGSGQVPVAVLAGHGSVGCLPDRPGSCNMLQAPAAAAATAPAPEAAAAAAPPAAAVPVYRADGALFVQELLQLLRSGAAAGNTFLANLKDLLECAMAASAAAAAGAEGSSSEDGKSAGERSPVADNKKGAESEAAGSIAAMAVAAVPIDAAAFLGMLQEAAAPLMAAVAAAAAAPRSSVNGHQAARRGLQRMSEVSGHGPVSDSASMGGFSMGGGCSSSAAGGAAVAASSNKPPAGQLSEPGKGLRPIRTDRGGSSAGVEHGYGGDLDTPPGLLLRHTQLTGRPGGIGSMPGSPLFYPLHPRTTTSGGCGGPPAHGSCGGAAPGTPHGTPMLLVPQTLPELLSARAALMQLMVSAHSFVQSPAYARMAGKLDGVEGVYESMHDDPVVVKRRKCKEMAAMRDVIRQDQAFSQAVASLSSLRNHIYSLSRKVLIGFGHVEGLPVDLLLGGLTSELAAILTDTSGQLPGGVNGALNGGGSSSSGMSTGGTGSSTERASTAAAAANAAGAGEHGDTAASNGGDSSSSSTQSCLPKPVLEFFSSALPLPKLALLVFTEFVPVDPSPCCMTPAPGTPAATAAVAAAGSCGAAEAAAGSMDGASSGGAGATSGAGSSHVPRGSNLRHSRRGSNSSADVPNVASEVGREAAGSAPYHNERRNGNYRYSRDAENHSSRGGSFSSNSSSGGSGSGSGGSSDGSAAAAAAAGSGNTQAGGAGYNSTGSSSSNGGNKQRVARRSQQSESKFDLVAEAAALEAAATAAAPLVAAAVCDLPSGRKRGSNTGY